MLPTPRELTEGEILKAKADPSIKRNLQSVWTLYEHYKAAYSTLSPQYKDLPILMTILEEDLLAKVNKAFLSKGQPPSPGLDPMLETMLDHIFCGLSDEVVEAGILKYLITRGSVKVDLSDPQWH